MSHYKAANDLARYNILSTNESCALSDSCQSWPRVANYYVIKR